jgi:hypothetical protein
MIRSGTVKQADRFSGQWAFVDVGFSEKSKSCGFLQDDGHPEMLLFTDLQDRLRSIAKADKKPLNLLLEAPLSVAFNSAGNPTGRSIERRKKQSRFWYVGLGCSVLVAATYLLRAVQDAAPQREIRLFEGLVSFKPRGISSNHAADVLLLRKVVWEPDSGLGCIVSANQLATSPEDRLQSAFLVAGMDFGIPPVIAIGVQRQAPPNAAGTRRSHR